MKRLSENDKNRKREQIRDLQDRLEQATDIKRKIFLQATINILEKEIEQGFGFVD